MRRLRYSCVGKGGKGTEAASSSLFVREKKLDGNPIVNPFPSSCCDSDDDDDDDDVASTSSLPRGIAKCSHVLRASVRMLSSDRSGCLGARSSLCGNDWCWIKREVSSGLQALRSEEEAAGLFDDVISSTHSAKRTIL